MLSGERPGIQSLKSLYISFLFYYRKQSHKKLFKKMKRKFFVVAAVIISSQLQAQQDTTSKSLDEVVVTANKFQQKAMETGKVTTIISNRVIERSLGKDLAQLLTEQAGIVINGANSNPGKDKSFYLRGASNKYTVILINSVP